MFSFHAKVVHFTFYIVMSLQSGRNFVVDLKNTYFWKMLLVKMLCSISTLGFVGWVKALKLVNVFIVYLISFLQMTTKKCSRWNRQIVIMLVTYCYILKVFPRSDGIRIFVKSLIDKVVQQTQTQTKKKVLFVMILQKIFFTKSKPALSQRKHRLMA